MTKINLFLITSIVFSILSCSSKTENEASTTITQKKEGSSVSKTIEEDKEEPEINGETSETESEIDPEVDSSIDPVEDVDLTVSSPEQNSEPHLVNVVEELRVPVEEVDNYDFQKYEKLNTLLKKYVSSSGKVNYAGIKSSVADLNSILEEFESNYPKSSWSKNQKLTYWINAYNIYTIKLIVDNYPTTSITKITAKPWLKKFIKLGGSTISLNHIENEIIRKQFNEPRIHFALNCASKSCPVLLNMAYTPSNLQSKLTSQTKRFLNDTSKNKFEKKEITISKIFDWYGEDFTKNGTVISFINKYRTDQLASPKIKYMEYSWDLNN